MPTVSTKPMTQGAVPNTSPACYHCGEPCAPTHIQLDDKDFCCEGCKTVFEILDDNGMCRYYDLDEQAGMSLKGKKQAAFAYLDDPDVREKLIDFANDDQTRVTFFIPAIHCASCLWLLENLYKFNPGIQATTVNFVKKEVYVTFDESVISLRQLVELLDSIAYTPAINLSNLDGSQKPLVDRSFYYKFGVAGFAFGNIMLLSFPEYLGLDKTLEGEFFQLFGYLNILLALPLVFYSGSDYLKSAWLGLKNRNLNIDVPIALGVLTLFGRSAFEILTHTGAGYLDSLAGLVFFLLAGKWFQQRTYHSISFERDYKSYFPIAAHRKNEDGSTTSTTLDKLDPGDIIEVKNGELIPADGVLLNGEAAIDYSFVTGESEPVGRNSGEKVYAGGRQTGSSIEVSLTRRVSQSYLTQLWNDEAFTKATDSRTSELANRVGKYFTFAILIIAFTTLGYWLQYDTGLAVNAFTAVLIIACPCAVALAVPFIFGNALRVLARNRFFLKNTAVIEAVSNVQSIIFDKTGTLTDRHQSSIHFEGAPLDAHEKQMVRALLKPSSHTLSQQIVAYLSADEPAQDTALYPVSNWEEVVGQGVAGNVSHYHLKAGSAAFMDKKVAAESGVYIQINGQVRGAFRLENHFRTGLWEVVHYFAQQARLFLLSGDNDRERSLLEPAFEGKGEMFFRQSPQDKLQFVRKLQAKGENVMMLGDGLNDAGALKQSDAGIVVAENTNNFTPACDAILDAAHFDRLPGFVEFARKSIRLVYYAYGFALIYNIIGLSFAVQGALSPIVAAILMPLSSISIVLFGTLSSNILARKLKL
ncbi:MAG: heavy metal translocating P-type ATPase [Phaeodactylibacter xiamenensis]|nr:heavy metal translocating P-type ATPase metal-binding domain-containing protein [Phaeodactylibacter xiamenensis]MCR9053592.1 heavy metal translocating P-type ATPase metal-binding domain-containing protein [bacterium]